MYQWPYKNFKGKTKAGKEFEVSYVKDILVFIKMISEEVGSTFLDDTSGQFDTVEEIVKAFNKAKPFKDKFLNWCIGGEMEMKDDGHPKYYMFLPDFKKGFKLFAKEEDAESVAKYDAAKDLKSKDGPKKVASFQAGDSAIGEDEGDTAPPWAEAEEGEDDMFSPTGNNDDDPFPEGDMMEV